MITANAFISIERALSKKLNDALSRVTKEVYSKVDAALLSGDYDKAQQEFSALSVASIRDSVKEYVEFMTHVGMLFGASRVTQQPGTSVVGMGFEALSATQMANAFLQGLCQKADAYLKEVGAKLLNPSVSKGEVPPPNPPSAVVVDAPPKSSGTGEGRVLHPFSSFMDSAGKSYFNITSSLHTSRVSAYGFTAEAAVLGVTEYQLSEQLDGRTCPVCRRMHGKTFKVKDARALLDIVTRTTDPDDLKQLQPWPGQDAKSLKELEDLSNDELVARGWHIPPFHPRCRGLLTRNGKVPDLADVESGKFQEKYVTSKEDFEFLGVPVSKEGVKVWNNLLPVAPAEVVSRLSGAPVDEFLASMFLSEDPKKDAGIKALNVSRAVTVTLEKALPHSESQVKQTVVISNGDVLLKSFKMKNEAKAAEVFKSYMLDLYSLSKDVGAKTLSVVADGEIGSYAWAKYGFKPSAKQWEAMKSDIASKAGVLEDADKMTELHSKFVQAVLNSNDPGSIFSLADSTLGPDLLSGLSWFGSLDLKDAESVIRFLTYIGNLGA